MKNWRFTLLKGKSFWGCLLAAALLIGLFCLPASAQAQTIYLKGNSDGTEGGNNSNDGLSMDTAVLTLERAMELAGEDGTIIVAKGVSLTEDITIKDVTIQRGADYNGTLFTVGSANDKPTITLQNVTIDGMERSLSLEAYNYAPFFLINGGTVKIEEGAVLKNNHSTAIVVTNGELIMNGGEIRDNQADGNYGSAVQLQNNGNNVPLFTMTGGSIHHNEQTKWNGTVSMNSPNSTFTMRGGTIRDNTCSYGGGGVECGSGTVNLEGGTIANNKADVYGGGVYLFIAAKDDPPSCTLSGTDITGNTAPYGGGVGLLGAKLEIKGGSISSNTATSSGTGIFLWPYYADNEVTIAGGTIQGIALNPNSTTYKNKLSLSGSPDISEIYLSGDTLEPFPVTVTSALTLSQSIDIKREKTPAADDVLVEYASGLVPDPTQFTATYAVGSLLYPKGSGQQLVLRQEYKITFDVNGGDALTPSSAITVDSKLTDNALSPAPTRTGYTFDGWFTAADEGELVTSGTVFSQDTTLYAHWTPCTYSVALNPNDGAIAEGQNVTSYTYGSGATLPTDVTRSGYTFAGWYDNEDLNGTPVTEISATDTGNKEYWAKWTQDAPPYAPPAPVAPSQIIFTPNEEALPSGSLELKQGERAVLELGTIDNYAAFAAAGVEVTAVPDCDPGLTLSVTIDQGGKLTAYLSALESGRHQVQVMLTAPGCESVEAASFAVAVPQAQPVEQKIVIEAASGCYTGVKGVAQLLKADGAARFTVQGLKAGQSVTWKSAKPKYLSIDPDTGEAQLKKTGTVTVTATLSDGTALVQKVNVNKGKFADPEGLRLQTKVDGKWTDVTEEGIVVVPKKSGQKSVPSRLVGDGGKIVIESVDIDPALATRSGANPAPIKIKKRSLTDGQTTTLIIKANGQEFTLPITIDSTAKDLYPDPLPSEIQSILQQEE